MKKYLIADWITATGFEAPAVIVVIQKGHNTMPSFCQRAKAKLVIYHYEIVYAKSTDSNCLMS